MKLFEIKDLGKAGFMPYVIENGEPVFLFMETSDAKYGGDKPMIAKGHIDGGETAKEAGIREAEEELGLKRSNLKMDTVREAWSGQLSGLTATYTMTIFMGEVKDKKDFGSFHYETKATHWMTLDDYRKRGRKSQLNIVEKAHSLLVK
jgi:8-oxo-dGTP pyrophosphatase MutT (NUDIX family)